MTRSGWTRTGSTCPRPCRALTANYLDVAARALGLAGEHGGPAVNVNTLGEVPNSSWYTNRHYHERLRAGSATGGAGSACSAHDAGSTFAGGAVAGHRREQ